jgi:hypothetical protein
MKLLRISAQNTNTLSIDLNEDLVLGKKTQVALQSLQL